MSYVWGVSCLLKTFFLILLTFWTFLFTISIILKYGFLLDFVPVINSSPLFLTKNLKDYQNQLSSNLIKQYFLNKKSLVIDIGSNDGTLLSGFKKKCKNISPPDLKSMAFAQEGLKKSRNPPPPKKSPKYLPKGHQNRPKIDANDVRNGVPKKTSKKLRK